MWREVVFVAADAAEVDHAVDAGGVGSLAEAAGIATVSLCEVLGCQRME
jgi:hypothetical protein